MLAMTPVPVNGSLSGAAGKFFVEQNISNTVSSQFSDISSNISFSNSVRCVLTSSLTPYPISVILTSTSQKRGSRRRLNEQEATNIVQVFYQVTFLFPVVATGSKFALFNEYYNNLSDQLNQSVTNGHFTAILTQFCMLNQCTLNNPLADSKIQLIGPFLQTLTPTFSPITPNAELQLVQSSAGIAIVTILAVSCVAIVIFLLICCSKRKDLERKNIEELSAWMNRQSTSKDFAYGQDNGMRTSYIKERLAAARSFITQNKSAKFNANLDHVLYYEDYMMNKNYKEYDNQFIDNPMPESMRSSYRESYHGATTNKNLDMDSFESYFQDESENRPNSVVNPISRPNSMSTPSLTPLQSTSSARRMVNATRN